VTELRVLRKQLFNTLDDVEGDAPGCRRIVGSDVGAQQLKIGDWFRRPSERHTPLGAPASPLL
jgi:hypothetical protein